MESFPSQNNAVAKRRANELNAVVKDDENVAKQRRCETTGKQIERRLKRRQKRRETTLSQAVAKRRQKRIDPVRLTNRLFVGTDVGTDRFRWNQSFVGTDVGIDRQKQTKRNKRCRMRA